MSGLWEPLTTPPVQDWRVLSSPLSLNIVQHACDPPKVFLKIQMRKIIIYSGQQPCGTGEQTLLCFTFCYNCHLLFPLIPAVSAEGEKYLMPTVSVHVLSNETFGICKEHFVGLGKCKFLCIVMRSAYYSNFCGLHCIGLNFAPVPL